MLLEANDAKGRRIIISFTEGGIAYRDITNVYRWYRRVFIPGIVASIVLLIAIVIYAIMAYQNTAAMRPMQQYYMLLAGLAASVVILAMVRLTRPGVEHQVSTIPIMQVWSIAVYRNSGLVYIYRYGFQTPEIVLRLGDKDLRELLEFLKMEPWASRTIVY